MQLQKRPKVAITAPGYALRPLAVHCSAKTFTRIAAHSNQTTSSQGPWCLMVALGNPNLCLVLATVEPRRGSVQIGGCCFTVGSFAPHSRRQLSPGVDRRHVRGLEALRMVARRSPVSTGPYDLLFPDLSLLLHALRKLQCHC